MSDPLLQENFLAPPNVATTGVIWLDVNSNMSLNGRPDLLANVRALVNSLFNLFSCPIGARGPIFEPEYGCMLANMLQEPMDALSANKIKASLIQSVQKWEPRIEILLNQTSVTPDYNANAFRVTLVFLVLETQEIAQNSFLLNRS